MKTIENPPVAEPKPVAVAPVQEPPKSGGAASSFFERMTLAKKEKKEAEKSVEAAKPEGEKKEDVKPVVAAPEKPVVAAPEKPVESAPAKPKVAKKVAPLVIPPDPVDHAAIATAAATAAVAAATKPAKREEPALDIDDEEKETVAVLERMEKEWPDTYRGHSKKYVESLAKAKKYQANWEATNKGKKFDPEDDEHDEFFKDNEVDWNDVHFNRAIAKIEADKVQESARTKDAAKNKELEERNRLLEATPAITNRRSETAKTLFGSLGDDYKSVINEDGTINGAEVKRLVEEDPLRSIAFQAALRTELFAEEIFKITNRLVEFDDTKAAEEWREKNGIPTHTSIANFVDEQEARMMEMPSEDRVNHKGQHFATAAQYAVINPARRHVYWRFSDKDIADLYAEREAIATKEAIAEEEKRVIKAATRRGLTKVEALNPPGQPVDKPKDEPAPVVEKPVSPVGGVGQRPAQLNGNGGPPQENKTGGFLKRWGVVD